MAARARRVVVVGAGVTGLTGAYRLLRTANGDGVDVTVVEAASRAGGKLRTGGLAGFPVEDGADSFVVRKPEALDLCRELGLGVEVVAPAPAGAWVWTRGRLVPFPSSAAFGVPAGIEELARWPGLGRMARARALADLLLPPRKGEGDESILGLASRRLGPEAARVLVAPLLAGIHAGDAARLSVLATFPELRDWERRHGSLVRGAKAAVRAARRKAEEEGGRPPLFATVWTGLSQLVSALVEAVGEARVRLGEPVAALERRGSGWAVRAGGEELAADAVVLATPAFESGRLLRKLAPDAARELEAIAYTSTAVVTLAYPPGTIRRLPAGSGFIVPPGSGLDAITACTFVSYKWPREEHGGRAVVRCYAGRTGEEEALSLADDALAAAAAADVRTATGMPDEPEAVRVVRWNRAMPQYEVGHLDRLDRIAAAMAALPGIVLAGGAYRGIGVADCVRQGSEAAASVRRHLAGRERRRRGPARGIEQEAIT